MAFPQTRNAPVRELWVIVSFWSVVILLEAVLPLRRYDVNDAIGLVLFGSSVKTMLHIFRIDEKM